MDSFQGGIMRKWFTSLLVALAIAGVTASAQAQPSLKMMIPANPGGGWDQTGRNLANAMQSAKLVSSVQFDNKGGAGGTDHILAGLIAKASGVDAAKVNYVPFKGGGEAIAAIVGGHVTVGVSGIGEFAEQIKGGRMRALAVSSPKRTEGFQTLKEQGIDVELANWRGIFGAPAITAAQTAALIKIVQGATESASWKETLSKLGWSPIYLSGEPYKKFIDEDTKRIAGIIDSLGIKTTK